LVVVIGPSATYLEPVTDAEQDPLALRALVRLPLRLRRWSGWPGGKGHCARQRRLLVRDADGEAMGSSRPHSVINSHWTSLDTTRRDTYPASPTPL